MQKNNTKRNNSKIGWYTENKTKLIKIVIIYNQPTFWPNSIFTGLKCFMSTSVFVRNILFIVNITFAYLPSFIVLPWQLLRDLVTAYHVFSVSCVKLSKPSVVFIQLIDCNYLRQNYTSSLFVPVFLIHTHTYVHHILIIHRYYHISVDS